MSVRLETETELEAALRSERAAREQLDRILSSIGEAFFALDADGRFTYVNDRAETLLDHPRHELLGEAIWDVFPGAVGSPFWLQHQRAMDEGAPAEFEEYSALLATWFAVRAYPSEGGLSVFLSDVTERRALLARERASAARARGLAALAEGLTAAVDAEAVARVAVEQARAVLGAEVAALVQVEDGLLHITDASGYGDRAPRWDGLALGAVPGPLSEAIRSRGVVAVGSREEWRQRYGEPTPDVENEAWAAVPLLLRRGALGALKLGFAAPRDFGPEDCELLLALGLQVAQALDRARLYERVSEIAHVLQQGLLPRRLPSMPHMELAVRYRPLGDAAEVGGDFYDVFEAGEGEWALALGDVSGKGTEAAVLNGMARNMIRAITLRERDPVTILASLNAAILQHGDGERFCTVVLATLRPDGDGWALTLASAGHPPPLVLRTDGGIEAVPVRGDLLGLFGDVNHERAEVRLAPGDAIVFHTDGITEARRGEELFGDERLRAAVQQARGVDAEALADRIESVVQDFARGVPRDDEAVVVLRVSPRP